MLIRMQDEALKKQKEDKMKEREDKKFIKKFMIEKEQKFSQVDQKLNKLSSSYKPVKNNSLKQLFTQREPVRLSIIEQEHPLQTEICPYQDKKDGQSRDDTFSKLSRESSVSAPNKFKQLFKANDSQKDESLLQHDQVDINVNKMFGNQNKHLEEQKDDEELSAIESRLSMKM